MNKSKFLSLSGTVVLQRMRHERKTGGGQANRVANQLEAA